MEIVICHACQELLQVELGGNDRLHNQRALLGAQVHLRTGAEANLLGQASRDPHAETVAPFLNARLHGKELAIRRLYGLWLSFLLHALRVVTVSPPVRPCPALVVERGCRGVRVAGSPSRGAFRPCSHWSFRVCWDRQGFQPGVLIVPDLASPGRVPGCGWGLTAARAGSDGP